MGKSLKGKELGRGIVQRKDGKYSGRYTGADGKRYERVCEKLSDARIFVKLGNQAKTGFVDIAANRITVDEWFEFWMATFKSSLSPNTQRNYRERYIRNIRPVLGKMRMQDVRAVHCQKIINSMKGQYAVSTIYQAYICLGSMLKSALLNDIICKQPLDGVSMPYGKAKSSIRYLTVKEQLVFMEAIRGTCYEPQYQLVLQTGLRTGELIGLTWDNVDFSNRKIIVNKQMEFRYGQDYWRGAPPKSLSGYRTIPMTSQAYELLYALYRNRGARKPSPMWDKAVEYYDYMAGETKKIDMKNLVFIGERKGEPVKNSAYDTHLYKVCKDAGIKNISMHTLRHTFATRCIERGVPIKALQTILGHANITTTMDTYVHASEDFIADAMKLFET